MKTDLKAKYIQHLISKKNNNEGFTLIELLVVIIIIGILSAIALPSFLNQANKAKQSEAKTYVGSMNRGQQAIYTEKTRFGTSVEELGIGIETQTENYKYETSTGNGVGVSIYAYSEGTPIAQATAVLKGYSGTVFLTGVDDALTSVAVLCEDTAIGEVPAATADCTN